MYCGVTTNYLDFKIKDLTVKTFSYVSSFDCNITLYKVCVHEFLRIDFFVVLIGKYKVRKMFVCYIVSSRLIFNL